MPQRLSRSIAWILSKPEWWLGLALIAAYALLLWHGSGRTRWHTLCAFPLAGASLLAAIRSRHVSTFALLSAAAVVPPAIVVGMFVTTPRGPLDHDCNPGSFIAVAWLGFGVAQVAVMALLAPLFRGFGRYVMQRRVRVP